MEIRQCKNCGKPISQGFICFECVQKRQKQYTEARKLFGKSVGVKMMTRQELMIECDMLQGNINRMMVTDNKEEMYEMYYWASARLGTLLRENRKRIELKQYEENDHE